MSLKTSNIFYKTAAVSVELLNKKTTIIIFFLDFKFKLHNAKSFIHLSYKHTFLKNMTITVEWNNQFKENG